MIQEIIFDCFGVLTQDGWTAFIKKYAKPEMMDDLHAANVLADKGVISYKEFLKRVSDITGTESAIVHKMITASLHPNEDVFAFINTLSKSYTIGVISNVGSPLETYFPKGYTKPFSVQTLSFQEGLVKPGREIFDRHLQKSGYNAAEAVFIDDRESNCEGARVAGLHAIHFKNLEQLKRDLKKLNVNIA